MRTAAWGLVLLAVALMLPEAAAQSTATPLLEWELQEGTLVLEPLEEVAFDAVLNVSCASGSVTSPTPWDIQIWVEAPEGFVVAHEPATVHVPVDPVACASGEVLASEQVAFSIGVHHLVPGGTTTNLVLSAKEDAQEEPTTAPLAVEVAPFFKHQVRFDHAIHKVQPGQSVRLAVDAANFGNVDVLLKPRAGEGSSDALTPTWEGEWLLGPEQEATFVVDVATDGGGGVYENRRDALNLVVEVLWVEDPSVGGDAAHLQAVIQQQGSPALEAPAPFAPALFLIALASLAALRRR